MCVCVQALNFTLKICIFKKKQLTTSTICFNLLLQGVKLSWCCPNGLHAKSFLPRSATELQPLPLLRLALALERNGVDLYDLENSITEDAKSRGPKTGKSMQSWRWPLFVDRRCYREVPKNVRVREEGHTRIWSQCTGWESSLGSFCTVFWPLCKGGKDRTERKKIRLWWGFMWERNLCKTSHENVCLLQFIWWRYPHVTIRKNSLANFFKSKLVLKRNLGMIT